MPANKTQIVRKEYRGEVRRGQKKEDRRRREERKGQGRKEAEQGTGGLTLEAHKNGQGDEKETG